MQVRIWECGDDGRCLAVLPLRQGVEVSYVASVWIRAEYLLCRLPSCPARQVVAGWAMLRAVYMRHSFVLLACIIQCASAEGTGSRIGGVPGVERRRLHAGGRIFIVSICECRDQSTARQSEAWYGWLGHLRLCCGGALLFESPLQIEGCICAWGVVRARSVRLRVDVAPAAPGYSLRGTDWRLATAVEVWDVPSQSRLFLIQVRSPCLRIYQ